MTPSQFRSHTCRIIDIEDLAAGKEIPINILDVAWALSKYQRFGGHTFMDCNVGEHSVRVEGRCLEIMYARGREISDSYTYAVSRAWLFHDAPEAYLGDVISPLKRRLPEYRVLERECHRQMALHFDFPEHLREHWQEILKQADREMLSVEFRDCQGVSDEEVPPPPGHFAYGWSQTRAREMFLRRAVDIGVKV